jgi:hypothetical protein
VRDKRSLRITDVVELQLPPMQYDTVAVWAELPAEIKQRFRRFDPARRAYSTDGVCACVWLGLWHGRGR